MKRKIFIFFFILMLISAAIHTAAAEENNTSDSGDDSVNVSQNTDISYSVQSNAPVPAGSENQGNEDTTSANRNQGDITNYELADTGPEDIGGKLESLPSWGYLLIICGLLCVTIVAFKFGFLSPKSSPTVERKHLTLRVRYTDNTPVANASLILIHEKHQPIRKQTGIDGDYTGFFSSDSLSFQPQKVEIVDEYGIKRLRDLDPKKYDQTITIPKPVKVDFKILDEVSHAPVVGATVKVFGEENFNDPNLRELHSDLGGLVSSMASNENFEIQVSHRDYVQFNRKYSSANQEITVLLPKKRGSIGVQLIKENTDPALINKVDLSGIRISALNSDSGENIEAETDVSGKVFFEKVPIGEYNVQIDPNSIIETDNSKVHVKEDIENPVKLKINYKYRPETESKETVRKIQEILDRSYMEVSSYDNCIPEYLRQIGKTPLDLSLQVMSGQLEYQLYFIRSSVYPEEFINYMVGMAEGLAGEIATIIRDKDNIDLYAEAVNLPKIENVELSRYSIDELKDLLRNPESYYESNYRGVLSTLEALDRDITRKSAELTVNPVADLWTVSNRFINECINESNPKKQGIMIFVLKLVLKNLEEMFHNKDVIKRLEMRVF